MLLGRFFGLWVKWTAEVVVSVILPPFQACSSASWLFTSVSRTLLPQQVSTPRTTWGSCGEWGKGSVVHPLQAVFCTMALHWGTFP